MKWLGVLALTMGTLSACEKDIPFEYTKAATLTPVVPTPVPSLDAGGGLLDAQTAPQVDSGPVVETPTAEFTKEGLLKSFADCSLARYREFNERAAQLRDAARVWATNPTDELRVAVQVAWRAANESWQQAELFRFGPSGPASEPGGKDTRNEIYFFPDVNDCQVDQQLVSRSYSRQPLAINLSAKGLGALEYLLFYAGSANSCTSAVTINGGNPSPWSMLTPADLTQRRAEYAAVLADDISARAAGLVTAWDPAQGNFHAQLAGAGTPASQAFAQQQDAFNVVDNALFYWDKELKDYKVAIPVGLSMDCTAGRCPERVESRFSQSSNSNIVQNIRGFRLLFQGCGPNFSGLGFDDYLRAIGKGELADRMSAGASAAQVFAETLPAPLDTLVTSDPARVIALHAALKVVSDPLKAEFVSSLNLELPAAAQGDND